MSDAEFMYSIAPIIILLGVVVIVFPAVIYFSVLLFS